MIRLESSDGSTKGSLYSKLQSPIKLIAYFIGMGLTSQNTALIISVKCSCVSQASVVFPEKNELQIRLTERGIIFESTEITPQLPKESRGKI